MGGGSLLAALPAKPPLKGEVPAIGGRRGSFSQRRQVANAPTLRRNQTRRSNPAKRQPLFGREGSGGRGASLREAASPPSVPFPMSLREGVRGRVLLYREALSPGITSSLKRFFFHDGAPAGFGGEIAFGYGGNAGQEPYLAGGFAHCVLNGREHLRRT